jgi:hypothetical protein
MQISELKIETHHHGRYLLTKVITSPQKNLKMIAVIQDEHDQAVLMQLCLQEDNATRPASSILDKGMVVIVKEPYFMFLYEHYYVLRVDHVSDILWLPNGDERTPIAWCSTTPEKSAFQWNKEGSGYVKEKKFWEVIEK